MNRAPLHLLVLLLAILPVAVAAQQPHKKPQLINWGIRGGVVAPSTHIHSMVIDEVAVDPPKVNTDVSYLVAAFCRINLRRSFLQLELEHSNYLSNVHLFTTNFIPTAPAESKIEISERLRTFDIPILYGFNFIKQPNYEMSAFVGGKVKNCYSEELTISREEYSDFGVTGSETPILYAFIVGMGTSISNCIIEFRYELIANTLSNRIDYEYATSGTTSAVAGSALMKKQMNVLSFSLGFVF